MSQEFVKHSERIAAMEALCAEIGCDVETVHMDATPMRGTLHLFPDSQKPTVREALMRLLGEPERPTWDKKIANFQTKGEVAFTVRCYDWPWPTCGLCGSPVPSDSTVIA